MMDTDEMMEPEEVSLSSEVARLAECRDQVPEDVVRQAQALFTARHPEPAAGEPVDEAECVPEQVSNVKR